MPAPQHIDVGRQIIKLIHQYPASTASEIRGSWPGEVPGEDVYDWCLDALVNDEYVTRDSSGRLTVTDKGDRVAHNGDFTIPAPPPT